MTPQYIDFVSFHTKVLFLAIDKHTLAPSVGYPTKVDCNGDNPVL